MSSHKTALTERKIEMAREVVHIPARPQVVGTRTMSEKKIRLAAYCRVSSEQDEQLNSFENQVSYYKEYISSHPDYELSDVLTEAERLRNWNSV